MQKIKQLILIDFIAFISFILSIITGIILWIILPRGGGGSFIGLHRHTWITFHIITGVILGLIVLFHLIMHWKWIRNVPKILKN